MTPASFNFKKGQEFERERIKKLAYHWVESSVRNGINYWPSNTTRSWVEMKIAQDFLEFIKQIENEPE